MIEKKLVLHAVTNSEDDGFVGIRIDQEKIHLHYPETYDLAPTSDRRAFRSDVIHLLGTLSLAKSRSSAQRQVGSGKGQNESFAFLSYLWMIGDYSANGFYHRREKVSRLHGKGKINWKQTMRMQPIVSGGNLLYSNWVTEEKSDCDDLLAEAYRWCVWDSLKKAGWLFGLSEKSVSVSRATDAIIKSYIHAVQTAQLHCFDDGQKQRLRHMLRILSGISPLEQTKPIVYGVEQYHEVYEHMIDAVFGNITDHSEYEPRAYWYLNSNGGTPMALSPLRPDTIYMARQRQSSGAFQTAVYVLDAKYYRFGVTGDARDLPAASSIQKQLTYGDHILNNRKEKEKITELFHAFLLPYNKRQNRFGGQENLFYIGYAKAGWRVGARSEDGVSAFLIDMKHLIYTWAGGNNQKDIANLIRGVERAIDRSRFFS